MGIATLITWLLTASIGVFMLSRWILRGGLRRPASTATGPGGDRGLPPWVVFCHFGFAMTGLLLWAAFLVTGADALAWVATGLLLPAIGLGISTVTLWTPYPAYPPPSAAPGSVGGPAAGGRAAGYPLPGGARSYGTHVGGAVTGPAGGMLAGPGESALAGRLTDELMVRALTDDVLARRLTEEVLASIPANPPDRGRRRPKGHLAPLIPAAHGMGAIATFLLAVLTAIAAR